MIQVKDLCSVFYLNICENVFIHELHIINFFETPLPQWQKEFFEHNNYLL